MKTYLLNIPTELKRFSQKLDAKALLCSKTWEVFNDEGNKEIFIFQNDGNLLISTNGDVIKSTWQFIAANTTIIITAEGKTTMLRPAFVDGVVFALQKDGTQECLFLIDEHEQTICPNRTLNDLSSYFAKKINRQREKEQQRRKQERLASIVSEHQDEIDALVEQKRKKAKKGIIITCIILAASIILSFLLKKAEVFCLIFIIVSMLAFFGVVGSLFYFSSIKQDAEEEVVLKYK